MRAFIAATLLQSKPLDKMPRLSIDLPSYKLMTYATRFVCLLNKLRCCISCRILVQRIAFIRFPGLNNLNKTFPVCSPLLPLIPSTL